MIRPSQLSCLGSSVVEYLPSKQYVVGWSPTRAALFSFSMEKDVQVSCIIALIYVGLTVSM